MGDKLRACVLDTETTGLNPETGDRVIEIGIVEMYDLLPTGSEFHEFINPDRPIPPDTTRVHGITDADVRDKPRFRDIADRMLDFIGDAPLIAHNASFDMGFLNAELARLRKRPIDPERFVDTVVLARRKLGGGNRSLDDLCKRFGIDLSVRGHHSAIVDCRLLAQVYLNLCGGKHRVLDFGERAAATATVDRGLPQAVRPMRHLGLASATERENHEAYLEGIKGHTWVVDIPGM